MEKREKTRQADTSRIKELLNESEYKLSVFAAKLFPELYSEQIELFFNTYKENYLSHGVEIPDYAIGISYLTGRRVVDWDFLDLGKEELEEKTIPQYQALKDLYEEHQEKVVDQFKNTSPQKIHERALEMTNNLLAEAEKTTDHSARSPLLEQAHFYSKKLLSDEESEKIYKKLTANEYKWFQALDEEQNHAEAVKKAKALLKSHDLPAMIPEKNRIHLLEYLSNHDPDAKSLFTISYKMAAENLISKLPSTISEKIRTQSRKKLEGIMIQSPSRAANEATFLESKGFLSLEDDEDLKLIEKAIS